MPNDSVVQFEFDELKLKEFVDEGSIDFDGWTKLISDVEGRYPELIEKISLVYETFLSKYPLCYGYWRRYAAHRARLCSVEKAVEVYERAVAVAPYSVAVWADYCTFSISAFEDPLDICRLFRRGLSFVGKDYLCHTLWDKYIEYEFSQQHWSSLALIYIQSLMFPTKLLHQYYDSFKKLVSVFGLDMGCQDNLSLNLPPGSELEGTMLFDHGDDIYSVINDLLDPSARFKALQKYLSIGEQFYRKSCQLNAKIYLFESNIHRPYFHVKPLDDQQLENWHQYLDFAESQGNFDWVVKLYERCLIPCAYYPEFWMRYVEYVESKGGREIANDALDRSTKIFLKNVPAIHLFNASFKEQIGDIGSAHAAFLQCDSDAESYFVDSVMRRANMEKRLGNFLAASNVYKEALEVATEKKSSILPVLYVQFSRLQYMMTNSMDSARDVLMDAIQMVPRSKLLLTELLNFLMMHEGAQHVSNVDSIMADAVSVRHDTATCLSRKDREDISNLYLEFVNYCGTIHDLRRAWNRHVKLFPDSLRSFIGERPGRAGAVCKTDTAGITLPGCKNNDQSGQAIHCNSLSVEVNDTELDATEPIPPAIEKNTSDDGTRSNLTHHIVDYEDPEALHPDVNDANQEDGSDLNDVQKERKHGCEQDPKTLSLDCPSPNTMDEEYVDIVGSPSEDYAALRELSPSKVRVVESSGNDSLIIASSSAANACPDDDTSRHDGFLSPSCTPTTSFQTPVPGSSQAQECKPEKGNNWDRIISSPKDSTDNRDRGWSLSPRNNVHRHSEERDHRKRSLSPHRHRSRWHSRDQKSYEWSRSTRQQGSRWNDDDRRYQDKSRRNYRHSRHRDYSRNRRGGRNQNPDHIVDTSAGATQNVQQQNFVSVLPGQQVAYPQMQMSQYPIPSDDQSTLVQSSQAYNQMWQYYYYQQLLQQQQSYNQQQLLQCQPIQQQNEMQSVQQQQQMQSQLVQQQVQPQVCQLPMQSVPQQLQQLQNQPQQQQMLQNLPQHQQMLQNLPQHQQLPQQQQLQSHQLQFLQLQYEQLQQMYPQLQKPPLEQQQFIQQMLSQPQQLSYQLQQLQQNIQLLQQQPPQQQQPVQQQQASSYQQFQQQYLLYLQQQQQQLHLGASDHSQQIPQQIKPRRQKSEETVPQQRQQFLPEQRRDLELEANREDSSSELN